MSQKTAIIFGAGPAGLTAAYELLLRTDVKPIIFEMAGEIGGISKTVLYKGNRIDIGGHRFFSKSDRIIQWWQNILPLQGAPSKDDLILGRDIPLSQKRDAPNPEKEDKALLVRHRISRIYFLKKFFDYPISLSVRTLVDLGVNRSVRVFLSYLRIRLFPIKNENNLEDFLINRFGRELYFTFFRDYTQKVWGVPCAKISNEWGAQRVKGVSLSKVLLNAIKRFLVRDSSIHQRKTETSLIERFLYPKFGPGQMWEEVASIIREKGADVLLNSRVTGIKHEKNKIVGVTVRNEKTGEVSCQKGDYFFSSMPVKDLIFAFEDGIPAEVLEVADGLKYRASIIVGLLLKKLRIKNETRIKTVNGILPDNWIYIQEREVKLGRLQIFNNWSPYLVKDHHTVWIGLEYFCDEEDKIWSKSDRELSNFAINELALIGMIDEGDVLDSVVIRVPKTYPAYFGTYLKFPVIKSFLDQFENLYLIGRNGMHRYNNMDHSMLTAIAAVDNIVKNVSIKENIWALNTEVEYMGVHE
jgi:protoporphyrinogen oxidase